MDQSSSTRRRAVSGALSAAAFLASGCSPSVPSTASTQALVAATLAQSDHLETNGLYATNFADLSSDFDRRFAMFEEPEDLSDLTIRIVDVSDDGYCIEVEDAGGDVWSAPWPEDDVFNRPC